MILQVNTQSAQPIYEQLRDQIVLGIAANQFSRGEQLPPVRRLAADLGINLHTVNKAYAALCDEGYLIMDRRKGAVVAGETPDSGVFMSNLKQKLSLAAAEARCRKMGEEDFIGLCRACYLESGQN